MVVAGAAIATYLTALPNGFVFDARVVISDNAALINSREWLAWFSRPYNWGSRLSGASLYRPLAILSYLGTIRLAGATPLPFMIGNMLLHAGVSVLVLAVGRRLLNPEAALLGALIFAVHPLNTEAVAWVGGRTDLLAALFTLGSVLAFLRAVDRSSPRPGLYGLLSVASYLAAVLSKEHAITLPVWFALVWLLERRDRPARRIALALGASLAALVIYGVLRAGVPEVAQSGAWIGARISEGFWVPWRWFAGLAVAGKYAALFLWPSKLTFDYSGYAGVWAQTGHVPALEAVWGGVVVVGLVGALLWALRTHQGLAVVLAFIPVTYALVSGFPFTPQLVIAERFTYLPAVGACLATGWGVLKIAERVLQDRQTRGGAESARNSAAAGLIWTRSRWRARVGWGLFLGFCLLLPVRSAIRSTEWRTDETLIEAALAVSPDSPLALKGLAQKEFTRGNYQVARGLLERSIQLNPKRPEPYVLLAQIYARDRETERLVALSRRAATELPRRQELIHDLAGLVWRVGRPQEATELFKTNLARHPDFFPSRLALGGVLLDSGRAAEALEEFRLASTLRPDDPAVWLGMAEASLAMGRLSESQAYAAKAKGAGVRLPEDLPRALERGTP